MVSRQRPCATARTSTWMWRVQSPGIRCGTRCGGALARPRPVTGPPPFPASQNVMSVLKTLKEEIMALVDMMDTLNTWIRLHSPRFEEGNNFGVGVQEEIASMLVVGRSSSVALLETASKFHMARGHAAAKVRRHPAPPAPRASVRPCDEGMPRLPMAPSQATPRVTGTEIRACHGPPHVRARPR